MTRDQALARAHAAQPTREVPIGPLREAFLVSGRSAVDVARALDWYRARRKPTHRRHPDSARVRRTLGLKPVKSKGGGPRVLRRFCTYATALKLAEAIGVDPVDVGL